jgi:gliding motility-associated-like protein
MTQRLSGIFLLCAAFVSLTGFNAGAQINGVGHQSSAPSLNYRDSIYVYCASGPHDQTRGTLLARSPYIEKSVFNWEKYDPKGNSFIDIPDGTQPDSVTSRLQGLGDGLYRVTVKSGANTSGPYYAWVLHNWITAKAEIPDSSSTCESFKIEASFEKAPLTYYDRLTGDSLSARNPNIGFRTQWFKGSVLEASTLSPVIMEPPASENDVEYRLVITDLQFGCMHNISTMYQSKTTSADFSFDPAKGEAVLKVSFTNRSINYDSSYWHFSKELDKIKAEIALNPSRPVDSIDFVLTEPSPTYEYEWSGNYRVHLVTVKVNPTTGNCYDTLYMKFGENIVVETSLVDVPNVFTPNGDGNNDEFVVFTQSLKSMNIRIYNRWGGLVHSWKYSNIRESDYTHKHSVWDGRVNGRYASAGVYFYVVQAVGRDGEKIKKEGFIHLFR